MEKFSELKFESQQTTYKPSEQDFSDFKNLVINLVRTIHSDKLIDIPGPYGKSFKMVKAFPEEVAEGRLTSRLEKINTNRIGIQALIDYFKIKDYNHLKNFVNKFQKDLFTIDGRFFRLNSGFSFKQIIMETEKKGEENEDFVVQALINTFGPECNPRREVTASYNDLVLGIDITFSYQGEDKTVQVKPLVRANFSERGVIKIQSSGTMKNYKTDFIAFANKERTYGEKILMFKNEGISYDTDGKTIIAPYPNMIRLKN